MQKIPGKYLAAQITALLMWGVSFPALKIALRTNSSLTILFYRYLFAFLLIIPWMLFRRRKAGSILKSKKLLWLGVFNLFGSWLQFEGLRFTSAVKSAVLTQMMVVAVPLLAFFFLREKLNRWKSAAMGLSIIGAIMVSTNLDFRGLLQRGTAKGDLLTVSAVVFWGFFIVYTRKWAGSADAFQLLFANYFSVSVIATLFFLISGFQGIDSMGLRLSLFLALFCTVIPTALYNFSMREIEANTSAIIGPLEVVSGMILSFFILKERLTLYGLAGSLLIFFSIYLINLSFSGKNHSVSV